MTKREIASLAIKLMGVFILLKSITYIPIIYSGIFYSFQGGSTPGLLQTLFMITMSTGTALVPLAFSILIIILSDKISAWLIKDGDSVEATGNPVTKSDIMAVAISCLGLYFIVDAAPMLIKAFVNNVTHVRQQMLVPFHGPSGIINVFRQIIAPVVQIGLGVWLFAGSKGVVKLWKKIRS